MKKILLITTGGTISCGKGSSALSPALGGKELIALSNLKADAELECSDIFLLDSTCIKPKHWERLAKEILNNSELYDGFVITHGTDSLAYTAAMLSFLLCAIQKPIIITGSQKTIFEQNSDAADNLKNAVKAACIGIPGVYILFGNAIIYGTNGYKESTSDLNGFISVNRKYAGEIKNGCVRFFESAPKMINTKAPKYCGEPLNARIAAINITPGDNGTSIKLCADSGYNGIVLSGYGSGGLPDNSWESAIEYAGRSGLVTVVTTQCRRGCAAPSRYAVGNNFKRLNVLSAGCMTLECAYCKLLWLLSIYDKNEEICSLFTENLCGELGEN